MDPMQSSSSVSPPKKVRQGRNLGVFKGVRMRAWGKWVSEIRVPKTGKRIWLGSYDAPEKAARAYDAALYCIHGDDGQFNFSTDKRPKLPLGFVTSLTNHDIKAIAISFASSDASASSFVTSSEVTTPLSSSDLPVSSVPEIPGDLECCIPSDMREISCSSIENVKLDDFLKLDVDWLDSL